MPLKILIIPDKFKGTLRAPAAARAMAKGWRRARPGDSLDLLPMTDGGDGFGEVIGRLLDARPQRVKTVDAAHRPCVARWWWDAETKTAIIESAAVIGLAMLPPKKFHPFELDTFGLGAVVRAATAQGAQRCLMGIGGSATNDGGFGLARSLGWQLLDCSDNPIERWTDLDRLAKVRAPSGHRHGFRLTVAVDVKNPLLGPRGATRVYGPQKGLRRTDFAHAERCLGRLAKVVKENFGCDLARVPGAGAAGGLGFGLMAFLGAQLEPGFDLFARQASLDRRLQSSDLVVVGEGALDASTFMGKGVGQIAALCRRQRIPCIALGGVIRPEARKRKLFAQMNGLTELTSVRQARSKPAHWLERLATRVALDRSKDQRRNKSPIQPPQKSREMAKEI